MSAKSALCATIKPEPIICPNAKAATLRGRRFVIQRLAYVRQCDEMIMPWTG